MVGGELRIEVPGMEVLAPDLVVALELLGEQGDDRIDLVGGARLGDGFLVRVEVDRDAQVRPSRRSPR